MLRDALEARYADLAGPVRQFYPDGTGRVLDSWNDAHADLRRIGKALDGCRARIAHDDDALEAAADHCSRLCLEFSTAAQAIAYARTQHVTLPELKGRVTERSLWRRLKSPDWWRRQLRTQLTRGCEELFRVLGFVRAGHGTYCSDDGFARVRAAGFKTAEWVREMAAVCDTGEVMALEHLRAHSLANPALRRGELMTRARGFQEVAEACGHQALMVTLTAPSAFHAWLKDGERNPRFEGHTPRDAQRWLSQRWAVARAALQRSEVIYYGFRVAEPHHDATPHWHLVVYAAPQDIETIRVVLTRCWLKYYRDEPGAGEHRIKFTEEHPSKGSGVGYLAKYISKNIDAAGTIGAAQSDESTARISEEALRAVAWARLHGIRQFQQVRGPAVSLWRHLRRIRSSEEWDLRYGRGRAPRLEALRIPADAGSWVNFIHVLGGIEPCLKQSRRYWDKHEPRKRDACGRNVMRYTRWGEQSAPCVVGLKVLWRSPDGVELWRRMPTRLHLWELIFCPDLVSGSGSSAHCSLGPVAITVSATPSRETSQGPPS